MCYDDYEWWQRQDLLTQWLAGRTPDGAQVALTHIDVRVEGRWTLRQSTLGGMQMTYDYGSAELTLRGNMLLDYDMHALTTSAMRRCRGSFETCVLRRRVGEGACSGICSAARLVGNFEIGDLDVVPSLMPEAAAEAMLNPFLPVLAQEIAISPHLPTSPHISPHLAQEIAAILCYGGPDPEGGLNVVGAITPKVGRSRGGGDSPSPHISPHLPSLAKGPVLGRRLALGPVLRAARSAPRPACSPRSARDQPEMQPEMQPRCSRDHPRWHPSQA